MSRLAVGLTLNAMLDVLERGAIAFVYRPRVQTDVARGIEDVQGFYIVLVPDDRHVARRVRVGRKRLPDRQRRERFWAYVETVARNPRAIVRDLAATEYWTKTRGLRHQPGPRLVGDGAYALARHGPHVHLAYALHEPQTSEVRDELRIAREASYIVAAFARSVGAPGEEERRFVALEPDHLDRPGTELVLISAGEVPSDVRPELDPDREDPVTAALSRMVREASGRPASAPLLEGIWH